MTAGQVVGSVQALWRFPVKSMKGELLDQAELTPHGVAGDRAYALIDVETGKVASAKSVKRFPGLLGCAAAFVEPPRPGAEAPPVRIIFPDGTSVTSDSGDAERVLSGRTHKSIQVDLTLAASIEPGVTRRELLVGDGIVMTDDPTLCADAGFCGSRFTNVWKMIAETGDPEIKTRLERMVHNCPSGRLQFAETEGGAAVEPAYRPSIATLPNGPLWVRGNVTVARPDGTTYELRNRMTLCRCGNSQNKSFCDGAHKSSEFQAP